jgi:hypothetical protein
MYVYEMTQEMRGRAPSDTPLASAGETLLPLPPAAAAHVCVVGRGHDCDTRYAPARAAGVAGRLGWLLRAAWRIEAADECANSGVKPSSSRDDILVSVVARPSSPAAGSAP